MADCYCCVDILAVSFTNHTGINKQTPSKYSLHIILHCTTAAATDVKGRSARPFSYSHVEQSL